MSVQIIEGEEYKCLFCTTTMWAFGGVFYESEDPYNFISFIERKGHNVRMLPDVDFEGLQNEWRIYLKEISDAVNGKNDISYEFLDQLTDIIIDDVEPEYDPEYEDATLDNAVYRGVDLSEDDIYQIQVKETEWVRDQAKIQYPPESHDEPDQDDRGDWEYQCKKEDAL